MARSKTIGNGYALTAVLGNESVMKNAENCFISSTFGQAHRICAALKTIEVMERDDPFPSIQAMVKKLKISDAGKEIWPRNFCSR